MEKKARVSVYVKDAVGVIAKLNDFDGDVSAWKNAVYELFRWDMTWGFAYRIHVYESRKSGVFVRLTVKPCFKDNVLEEMESLGFRNVDVYDELVGAIECTDLPDDMLFDHIEVEY